MVVQESAEKLQPGDVAPQFELEGTDGEIHSLSEFEDHEALLVVFTCNHCPYAKAKFEPLNDIDDEFDEAAVVGINPNDAEEYPEDSFDRMKELVDEGTVDYTAYLRDETQEVAEAYGATCTPDPFLFRRDGDEWVLAYHGRLDDAMNPDQTPQEHYVRDAIETMLEGGEVDLEYMPSRGCSIKWKPGEESDGESG